MGTLEKILEEIDAHSIEFEMFGVSDDYISVGWVKEIIRKHMNDDWIPLEKATMEGNTDWYCHDECKGKCGVMTQCSRFRLIPLEEGEAEHEQS